MPKFAGQLGTTDIGRDGLNHKYRNALLQKIVCMLVSVFIHFRDSYRGGTSLLLAVLG